MKNNRRYRLFLRNFSFFFILTTFSFKGKSQISYVVTETYTCDIEITSFTGNTISVEYESLPANAAGKNKNGLWVWRAREIPWTQPPMARVPLPEDAGESGFYTIDTLSITENAYVVAYSVGRKASNICSFALLPKEKKKRKSLGVVDSECINFEITQVQLNNITITYQTFAGYLPMDYGNWVGLWKGRASPYNATTPIGKWNITDNSSDGSMTLDDIAIAEDQTYTLIYFNGKDLKRAAAIVRFKTN